MAFNFSPRVIQSGLVLYLDAANPRSYVSGSTRCNDLTANQVSCTLDGVSYDNSFAGIFNWDNSLDKITFNSAMSFLNRDNYSVCFWLRTTDTKFVVLNQGTNPYLGAVFVGGTASGNWYHSLSGTPITYTNGNLSTAPILDGTWNYYCFTNVNFSASLLWSTNIINILYYPGWEFSTGSLASFKIYDRNLSRTEIIQNYNATKSRFNIT